MVEEDDSKWEEQEIEVESLKSIFEEEELIIKREKPYNFEILVHSNTESDDRDYLKLKLIFDLPESYPNEIPYFRIKNLSPDYIDNNALELFENEMRERANESLGQMMIFELSDLLKEKITTINETVLEKLDKIEEDNSIANANKDVIRSDANKLNFTPVNEETFAIWCEQYKEKMRIEKERNATGAEDKPTGKQMFLMNNNSFDDIRLDELDEEGEEEAKAAGDAEEQDEEAKVEESEEEEEFVYDRALYDADGLEDEDVDFDDDD